MSLQLTAKCGKNLPKLDLLEKVDPYLVANFQGVQRKTQHLKSDQNPTWETVLDWDLGSKALEIGDFIEIDVKDWERVGRHRFIGCCKLSLKDIIRSKTRETQCTLQLKDGSDRLTTGEIELLLKYQEPKSASSGPSEMGRGAGQDETDGSKALGVCEPGMAGAPLTGSEGVGLTFLPGRMKREGLSEKPRDFQMRVKIWEARQLYGANTNPVCRVTVLHSTRVTKVKKSTNKPYWDELFFFQFNISPVELFDETIQFQVLDSHMVRSDAMIGSFNLDVGSVYQSEEHTFHNKWLLLTSMDESKSSGAKGYLLVSISVIGQGDDLPVFTKAEEELDIETNLIQPAGVDVRRGCFNLQVFQAEDLPQMDAAYFEGMKKVLRVGEEKKELVDPYLVFSFAGKSLETDVKYTNDHPEWNQELRLPIRFPSMCERLKLVLKDWDRLSNDDFIATTFIDINTIGSRGDDGFLPTFGPCFVNFYGSPREFDTFNDDHEALNMGRGEGAAYRGRVLLSLSTELGDPPDDPIVSISAHDIQRVDKYRRLRKYHLYAAFINATMVSETDLPVEFEVSIGNSGNKLDDRVPPQPSTTQPTNTVFDGNHYYFLPWTKTKPLIAINSEWEDISFRLEALNVLLHIVAKLEKHIEHVKTCIKSGASESEVATQVIKAIDKLIEDCKTPLPDFGDMKKYANELDNRRFELRRRVKLEIVRRATILRQEAIEPDETVDELEEYLVMLKDIAVEPQNSLPDVVIWMLCGSKRIAYIRVPAYEVLYSQRRKDACGRFCGRTFGYFLKYLKVAGKQDDKYAIPAMLRLKLWLGLECHSENFRKGMSDSTIAVYAETYENQVNILGQWSDKGLLSRPKFSDSTGKLNLPKNSFVTPEGWDWVSPNWTVSLDASLLYDADAGLDHFLEDCFEQSIRYIPGGEFALASTPYTTVKGDPVLPKEKIICPPGWQWDDAWQVDINRACDEEGYEYCVESTSASWTPGCKTYHMCRRKRWVRPRSLIKGFKVEEAKEEELVGDDWEYAPMFNMRFHATERKMDMVRRRRLHRKMVATTEEAASIFSLKRAITDDKNEKHDQPVPRILLEAKETHKYQLRAYMFQARNLIAADSDSFSDPFAFVSLLFRSQRTHVIRHSLSPTWDQTLVFEEIVVHGNPDFLAKHPPDIVVELFDYDAYRNDEFLGRVIIKPLVKVDPSDRQVCRLGWHSLQRGIRPAGELLASFELFLAKNHSDLPFLPPMKKDRYVVPSGIRPVMQRTVVEILCWGLRNMAKYMQMSVNSPSIEFEIGGKVIESEVIANLQKGPNFTNPVLVVVVDLPREELYTPPINIKVRDHRAFGRKPVVGIATISGLGKYRRLDSVSTVLEDDEPDMPRAPMLTVTDMTDGNGRQNDYTVIDVPDEISSKETKITFKEDERMARKKKFSVSGFRKFQWWSKSKSLDPEAVAEEEIDWWSKYYASKGDFEKCVSYTERGYDTIQILSGELEDQPGFDEFSDFCDTFELTRGKASKDGDPTLTGQFKGSFKMYPMPHELKEPVAPRFFKPCELPSTGLVEVLVRIYVVRAYQLCPQDRNGLSDPYIIVTLGKTVLDDVKKFIPNTLEPFFGRLFEVKTVLPVNKDLRVSVMDKDFLSRDDMIGETVIDLENRYLTRYRATCGLPQSYSISGPNAWRDSSTPRQILAEYCTRNSMAQPKFEDADPCTVVTVGGETYKLVDFERHKQRDEHRGPADQRLALYALHAQGLVREHVETRCLYNSAMPDLPQGQLEMWVDMFPTDSKNPSITPGPPFDISPRAPKKFQLRCIIWNTKNVDLQDVSFTGERMSDIYIKGWLSGLDEKQETDVHYRSLNGEGNFNWRFVFDMHYIPPERVLSVSRKEHFWSVSETETRVPPTLVIQIWDNDKFSADDFIGTLELDLNRMITPTKKDRKCAVEQLPGGEDESPFMSLFERKRVKGWWPCYNIEGEDGKKKLAGKVEMELEILDDLEITERPTAQGRDEPNQHPHLDDPIRPETSFMWFTSPWKSLRFIVWYNYKYVILTTLLITLLVIFLILFIYNIPSASVNRVFGG